MTGTPSFGRRGAPAYRTAPAVQAAKPIVAAPPVNSPTFAQLSSHDEDLQQWKRARKQRFAALVRPLSFTATACFGIASFVLPDSVNDLVQWPLYALAAVSFYIGIRRRGAG
jgi:hypothetical protein